MANISARQQNTRANWDTSKPSSMARGLWCLQKKIYLMDELDQLNNLDQREHD
jgi:hypothetical protein